MKTAKALFAGATAAAVVSVLVSGSVRIARGEQAQNNGDDITGVVTGVSGPEAGVWVIAETSDLPTRYAKIVVTDDQGRYALPDLPRVNFDVWVRGYGLVDSPKKRATPGAALNLQAIPAPNAKAAAEYYPAGYWYSLLKVPAESEFPGTGPEGNGINPGFKSQADYVRMLKNNSCLGCHQLGSKGTRELNPALGTFPNSVAAWANRLQSGQAGGAMIGQVSQSGPRTMQMFADWTDRIAKGEVPPAPPRPQGIERNVVITMWDWADPKAYLHDLVSTDRRHPTLNANGLIYGVLEASADYLPVLDPKTHTVSKVPVTVRDPNLRPPRHSRLSGRRHIGARSRSGRAEPTCTTRCSMRRGGCGSPHGFVRLTTRTSARPARPIPRRRCSRSTPRAARWPCTTPGRRR